MDQFYSTVKFMLTTEYKQKDNELYFSMNSENFNGMKNMNVLWTRAQRRFFSEEIRSGRQKDGLNGFLGIAF